MNWVSYLSLVGLVAGLAAVPSTSVALVVARSASYGFGHGVAVAVGIACADVLFALGAMLGVHVWMSEAGPMGSFFYLLAGCFLTWMGLKLIRGGYGADLAGHLTLRSAWAGSIAAGFLLTLADFKAIFFYASVFPLLFSGAALQPGDFWAVGILTFGTLVAVKAVYAAASAGWVKRFGGAKSAERLQPAMGLILVGVGVYALLQA